MSDNMMSEDANINDQAGEVFRGTMPDIRAFSSILRSVCFHPTSQRATLTFLKSGLIVYAEEARTFRIAAYVRKELFEEFEYNPVQPEDEDDPGAGTMISFQLSTLLECLNIFGTATGPPNGGFSKAPRQSWQRANEGSDNEGDTQTNRQSGGNRRGNQANTNGRIEAFFPRSDGKGTGMRISYAGEGHPLVLLLAESANGPTTTCELVTYEAEPQFDLPIDIHNLVLKCILKSSWIREALSELDPSSEKITFIGNPHVPATTKGINRPHFRIRVPTALGEVEMDYPNDKEVLETFECEETVSFSYRLSHVLRTMKALQTSNKTSLRIDAEGVMGLQFLTTSLSPKTGAPVENFVEFRCLSIDDNQ